MSVDPDYIALLITEDPDVSAPGDMAKDYISLRSDININENSNRFMKYYKVIVNPGAPKTQNIVPGYMTCEHATVSAYLSAFISSSKGDITVWVIEADINITALKQREGVVFGYRQDKTILPGYYGTEISPDDGILTPLSVIVYNSPINCNLVGGYVPSKNYDFSSRKYILRSRGYSTDGNAWRDSDLGQYTFDDKPSF